MRRRPGVKRISAFPVFLIQACFISWAGWLPALLLWKEQAPLTGLTLLWSGLPTPETSAHAVLAVLFVLGSFGAALSGLGITARLGGREGTRLLWRRVCPYGVKARWYSVVFLMPVALAIPAAALSLVAGAELGRAPIVWGLWSVPILFLFNLLTLATAEIGWRGLAQPLLQRTQTAEAAAYTLGLTSAIWLVPYVLAIYAGHVDMPWLALHLVGWLIWLLGTAVIQAWLFNNTSSLWLCMLYSGTAFTVWTFAAGLLNWQPTSQLVLGCTTWLVAWALLRRNGETLVRVQASQEQPPAA